MSVNNRDQTAVDSFTNQLSRHRIEKDLRRRVNLGTRDPHCIAVII